MQDDIVQKAVNGHSLLILGQSGTGKSFVCKEIARKLKEKCINVRLTATTGIASLNIGGQTVHSWCGIGDDIEVLVSKSVTSLKKGNIISVPTDTIYGIAGLAQDSNAINKIYNIKRRDLSKPIAISVADVQDIFRWSKVTVPKSLLDKLLPGAVTVVFERSDELNADLNPGTSLVGIRVPDHRLIREISQGCEGPIALTSANISAAQSTISVEEFEELWPMLDLIIDDGIVGDTFQSRQGSTVVDLSKQDYYKIIRDGSALKSTVQTLEAYGLTRIEDR